jgi:hypothetical protein
MPVAQQQRNAPAGVRRLRWAMFPKSFLNSLFLRVPPCLCASVVNRMLKTDPPLLILRLRFALA